MTPARLMTIPQAAEALLDELDRAERRRMLLAWQEIRAERLAREERIMACVRPQIEDTENG